MIFYGEMPTVQLCRYHAAAKASKHLVRTPPQHLDQDIAWPKDAENHQKCRSARLDQPSQAACYRGKVLNTIERREIRKGAVEQLASGFEMPCRELLEFFPRRYISTR